MSEASIYRWMKQESFQTALREARRDILVHTTTRLQQMSVRAVDDIIGRLKTVESNQLSNQS